MKNKLLVEELSRFKKLAGVTQVLNEGGEKDLADILIKRIVGAGEKVFPKEIGEVIAKDGSKAVIKVDYYRSLMSKDVLTAEESEVVKTINTRIAKKVGTQEISGFIINLTKDLDNARKLFVTKKFEKLFDAETGKKITDEVFHVKPEPPVPGPVDILNVKKIIETELANPAFGALSAEEKAMLDSQVETYVQKNNLSVREEQIKVWGKFNDANFNRLEQEIKLKSKEADLQTQQQVQPLIVQEKQAELKFREEQNKLKNEYQKLINKGVKKDNMAKDINLANQGMLATKNLVKLILWIGGVSLLLYGGYKLYHSFFGSSNQEPEQNW